MLYRKFDINRISKQEEPMRNIKSLSIIVSMMLAIAISACSTATTGTVNLGINGTAPGTLPAASISSSRSLLSRAVTPLSLYVEYPAGTPVGTINFTDLRVVLKEFEIEQDIDGLDGVSFDFNGPFVVDLINNSVSPDPGTIELPPGIYTQMKFKIDRIEGSDDEKDDTGAALVASTDPLFSHSIYMTGTYTPTGGSAQSFTFTYDIDAEFELKTAAETAVGFDIAKGVQNDIIVAFRLNKWFVGIDPADFIAGTETVKEVLKENIKHSVDYGKDIDSDGELDSSEDDDPDTEDSEDS